MLAAWSLHSIAAAEPISILVALPGGKPVVEVPGVRPTEPLITVGPEFVTVWAAQTPKLRVVAPRESFARVDVGVKRRRAASMRDVDGDIADERNLLAGYWEEAWGDFMEFGSRMSGGKKIEADQGIILCLLPSLDFFARIESTGDASR